MTPIDQPPAPEPCCDATRARPLCPDCCAVCGDWKAVKPFDHCQACLDAYYERLDHGDAHA